MDRKIAEVAALPIWADDWTVDVRQKWLIEREAIAWLTFGIHRPVRS